MDALQLTGAIITLIGSMFLFLGALGILRMPDVYNRMQTGTKATTMGGILTLGGLALIMPGYAPKIIVIALFVLITNPISSHALARAAHKKGIALQPPGAPDALAKDGIEDQADAATHEEAH